MPRLTFLGAAQTVTGSQVAMKLVRAVPLGVRENGQEARVLFSGDVGRYQSVLVKDPVPAPNADYIVAESTYGNRAHPAVPVQEQLEGVIARTFARGGVVLIPAFAVGRAQQMIWPMDDLASRGRLRPPIHLDSPMAVDATRIYAQYPEAGRVSLNGVGGQVVFLTHGARDAAEALAARITKERGFRTHVPELGETVELEPGPGA